MAEALSDLGAEEADVALRRLTLELELFEDVKRRIQYALKAARSELFTFEAQKQALDDVVQWGDVVRARLSESNCAPFLQVMRAKAAYLQAQDAAAAAREKTKEGASKP